MNLDIVLSALSMLTILLFGRWAAGRPRAWARPDATGVRILESTVTPADARCLICRHALAGDIVYCGRCRTPHHRDCFRYVGDCAVFACPPR